MENLKSKNKKEKLTRESLLRSPEFWEENIKTELFNMIYDYMDEHSLSQKQLAEKVGCSKGYISQLLNGDSDHRLSKLVHLALSIGKAPYLYLKDIEKVIEADNNYEPIYIDFSKIEGKAKLCDSLTSFHKFSLDKEYQDAQSKVSLPIGEGNKIEPEILYTHKYETNKNSDSLLDQKETLTNTNNEENIFAIAA